MVFIRSSSGFSFLVLFVCFVLFCFVFQSITWVKVLAVGHLFMRFLEIRSWWTGKVRKVKRKKHQGVWVIKISARITKKHKKIPSVNVCLSPKSRKASLPQKGKEASLPAAWNAGNLSNSSHSYLLQVALWVLILSFCQTVLWLWRKPWL